MEWRTIVRPRTLFVIATAFGISSTLQAWRLASVEGKVLTSRSLAHLAGLNFIYWYVPALAVVPILAFAYRMQAVRGLKLVAAHAGAMLTYGTIHSALMTAARTLIDNRPAELKPWFRAFQVDFFTQFDWMLMTYGALVGVAYALRYRQDAERRAVAEAELRMRLVEAQLQALRHQLQPHFLFNTLNTVAALMRTDVDAADNVLDQLGDLLRMTLDADGRQEVPLRREIEILEKYLQIEQARFRDRLTVSIAMTPDTSDALVPSLLLQPIVENAIRHGIAPHGRRGQVDILASRAGDRLRIEVRDTGAGISAAAPAGVGLTNTRARLERLYGSSQSLVLANRDRGGCAVTVTIPFKQEPASADPPRSHVA